ncbi:MAG: flagellar motor switch protein FliG [Candidatus Gastranaerophilales bacterium]|nr:flagellar motor switch protein FliG [Candidatus Gastranaerophilales bacterium]
MDSTNISIEYMTSTQKVAALLIALGPTTASEILKNITDDELLGQITLDIASLNKVSVDVLNDVLKEFYSLFLASDYLLSGGMNYAKQLLEKAYGTEHAQTILDKLVSLLGANPFQFFNDADPSQLATSFQNENPQLIALILAYLKPENSAQVLNFLPPRIQVQVAIKIAEMNSTNPEVLADIEKIVESKFSSIVVQDFSKAGGIQTLANILNRADRATEKNVVELLKDYNADLVEEVKSLMFVFEDIVNLDDRSIQRVLREVETKDIAMSLKGMKDDVKDKILKNMSERAQQMLVDDMEYMGPVRAKDVQLAQSKIVGIIRTLETAGEIVIFRGMEEDELIE